MPSAKVEDFYLPRTNAGFFSRFSNLFLLLSPVPVPVFFTPEYSIILDIRVISGR